ncbi:hypothetical protein GCM10009560_28480 [Nonomuraea longicatena]|uniref:Uncharacterized protein n=1 Tax=Nonomuraea longicatena TaxID=83682 RepID=A0ABN1PDT1_9ACTN
MQALIPGDHVVVQAPGELSAVRAIAVDAELPAAPFAGAFRELPVRDVGEATRGAPGANRWRGTFVKDASICGE